MSTGLRPVEGAWYADRDLQVAEHRLDSAIQVVGFGEGTIEGPEFIANEQNWQLFSAEDVGDDPYLAFDTGQAEAITVLYGQARSRFVTSDEISSEGREKADKFWHELTSTARVVINPALWRWQNRDSGSRPGLSLFNHVLVDWYRSEVVRKFTPAVAEVGSRWGLFEADTRLVCAHLWTRSNCPRVSSFLWLLLHNSLVTATRYRPWLQEQGAASCHYCPGEDNTSEHVLVGCGRAQRPFSPGCIMSPVLGPKSQRASCCSISRALD